MKKFLITAATVLMASTSTFAGAAYAAPPSYERHDNDRRDNDRRDNDRHDNRGDQRDFRNGSYEVSGHRYERARGPAWKAPRGYQARHWNRGDRLPNDYRRVVVRDYRSYHLAAPPRGYEYNRVGNDVVLTAIASGIIGAVVANVFAN